MTRRQAKFLMNPVIFVFLTVVCLQNPSVEYIANQYLYFVIINDR